MPPSACAFHCNTEEITPSVLLYSQVMSRLDEDIGPLVAHDGDGFSHRWGFMSIAGAPVLRSMSVCAVRHAQL